MRKVFIVLMALLVCANVFAAATEKTVTVKSHVGTLTISDANTNSQGGLYTLRVGATTDTAAGSEYVSGSDITQENVVAGFKVVQTAQTKTSESINLAISVGELINDEDASKKSGVPTLSQFVKGAGEFTIPTDNLSGVDYSFTVQYEGPAKPVNAETTITSFIATWPQTAGLPEGDYTATVTLSYTIQ